MDKLLIYILEHELLKSTFTVVASVLTFVVLYLLFIRKPLKKVIKSLTNFSTIIEANNEITKTMAFLQLQEQFYRKREEGSKSAHEDERWQRLWRLYEDLGDGEGDSLKREWEKIPIK
ncbi:MAG: hypothetical protein IKP66_06505 [Lachnospiraceae bacterium]|nr:hypothetical protein [Lachnospiraceae bacterium]